MRREPPVDERDTDSERGPREPQKEPPKEPPKNPMKTTGTIRTSIRTGNTTRPPKRSVIKPRGMRNREPRITGVAITTLIWKLESSYSS
jgi:hypothetical protein